MSLFPSILVPLDGSGAAAQSLGCAVWLASRLDARLHVLTATGEPLPAREALERLQVPEAYRRLVTLHQASTYAEAAILETVARLGARLVVMTARGEAGAAPETPEVTRLVGHVTQAVIEQSDVPVLLLPPRYREALPWVRVLVPVSGETRADEALALAVRLAGALDLEVHAAHVTDHGDEEGLEARARYADALHHEFPQQLEEIVRRALPGCTPEECGRVEGIALGRGEVAAELGELVRTRRVSLLVAGWRGRFMAGRARVLKRLIETVTIPVLLVKPEPRTRTRLKVAEELERD
jgi:nucleotide-binding universal stress UspA family protein